jgi:hypothetical protein
MSEPTHFDPWGETGRVATTCHEADRPSHSQVLGPDGKPLAYARQSVGFDLKPKQKVDR